MSKLITLQSTEDYRSYIDWHAVDTINWKCVPNCACMVASEHAHLGS